MQTGKILSSLDEGPATSSPHPKKKIKKSSGKILDSPECRKVDRDLVVDFEVDNKGKLLKLIKNGGSVLILAHVC